MSSSINGILPEDLLSHTLGFLSPEDLARAKGVCRDWRVLASEKSLWDKFDLREVFPKLSIIDEASWKRYVDLEHFGLSFDDATPLDKRVAIPALKALFKIGVEGDAGFTLLTLPRGLTFNKLVEIARSPKEGIPIVGLGWSPVPGRGDIPVGETITVALSNNILNGSRNLSYVDQKKLVEDKGCEMPGALSVVTLAFLTYIMSDPSGPPTRLYNDNPWTYARCLEIIDDYALCVGGFSTTYGLSISFNNSVRDVFGVGAMQKF